MEIRSLHQTPEEIIKNATAEQRILWNRLFLLGGDHLSISQLYFCGAIVGSEFLIYRARRIYFALEIEFGFTNGAPQVLSPLITLYDENNAIFLYLSNTAAYWNGTTAAPNYTLNSVRSGNLYFSRIVQQVYGTIKFIGYRIIY